MPHARCRDSPRRHARHPARDLLREPVEAECRPAADGGRPDERGRDREVVRGPTPGGAVRDSVEPPAKPPDPTAPRKARHDDVHLQPGDTEHGARSVYLRGREDEMPFGHESFHELQALGPDIHLWIATFSDHMSQPT